MTKVQKGDVMLLAHDLPSFLYNHDAYDPADPDKGLFVSKVMIQVRDVVQHYYYL